MLNIAEIFAARSTPDLPQIAPDLRERVAAAALAALIDEDGAADLFDEAVAALHHSQPDIDFVVQLGMLGERLDDPEDWLAFWNGLHSRWPLLPTPIKHLMRKFRRDGFLAHGLEKLSELYPDAPTDEGQRLAYFAGLNGLGESGDFELYERRMRRGMIDDIKLGFALQLQEERRYSRAMAVLLKLTPARQASHDVVVLRKALMLQLARSRRSGARSRIIVPQREVIPTLVRHAATLTRPRDPDRGIGPVVFFTGQLGAGGAERQMSLLSSELYRRQRAGETVGDRNLCGPIHVCLRNTDPARRGDFFLPVLRQVGMEPMLIDPLPIPGDEALQGFSEPVQQLLAMLRKGMRETTLKLIPYFQKVKPDVAYLWQDGGAMAAGLAALLTGTPRVVVSFRGLPPDKRPDRMREDMPILFQEMFKLPQVTYSANSATVAGDYEHWLKLPAGSIVVIPNAVKDLSILGDESDAAFWDDMVARSPDCTRTVVGLFRFDPNKRPLIWIEAAATLARRDPTVRFLLLGAGAEAARSAALIEDLGMADRIFMAGSTKNVGFFLNRCDLQLHLAETEGLPNAIIEAQLCGLPVLATPAGGTVEVVQDGVTGRFLPSAGTVDVDTIVTALEEMLSDPTRLAEMGRAAIERARPRYNIENVLKATVEVFAAPNAVRDGADVTATHGPVAAAVAATSGSGAGGAVVANGGAIDTHSLPPYDDS